MFSKRHNDRAMELLRFVTFLLLLQVLLFKELCITSVNLFKRELIRRREHYHLIDMKVGKRNHLIWTKVLQNAKPIAVVCYQSSPIFQVPQFTGIQAIIDNVKSAKEGFI